MNHDKLNTHIFSFENLSIPFLLVYIFFWMYTGSANLVFLFVGILSLFTHFIFVSKDKLRIDPSVLLLLLITIYCSTGTLYSSNTWRGTRFSLALAASALILLCAPYSPKFCKRIIKGALICTSIHVFFILAQIIFPSFVFTLAGKILPPITYINAQYILTYGHYSGICGFDGTAAYFSCFLAAFLLIDILSRKRFFNIPIFVEIIGCLLALVALIACVKRGPLTAGLLAGLLTFIVGQRKKISVKFLFSIFSFLLAFALFFNFLIGEFDFAERLFLRFSENRSDDFLSGRSYTYMDIFGKISKEIYLGHGSGALFDYYPKGAHNIYLQIIFENGIIALLLFLALFFFTITRTIKLISMQYRRTISTYYILLISLFYQFFFLIYGFSGNPLYDFHLLILYVISIAITIPYTPNFPRSVFREWESVMRG